MINFLIAIASVILGTILWWLWKIQRLPNETLEALGQIATILSFVNALIFFLFQPLSPRPFPTYSIQVQSRMDNIPLSDIEVLLILGGGMAPLKEYTDVNGFARFRVPNSAIDKPAWLSIQTDRFQRYVEQIDLADKAPPKIIKLTPQP